MNWQNNRIVLWLLVIIVLMGAEIVYLVYQNRQLHLMIEDPSRFFEKTLQAGETVPAIRAEDVSGNEIGLTYSPQSPFTLVLWFSPTCSSCEDNFGIWKDIYRLRNAEKLRIVGFCSCTSAEGRDAVAAQQLEFPVLAATDQSIVDLYKGNLLPQTILISPEGLIKQVWPGGLLESQKKEMLSVLSSLEVLKPEGGE